ncbi:CoA pyrophosphatase [Shewanella sedimentimangrovi]|uniref:CoA pyrophosphatase n=1 Tax=Shewanella sedimentimangrovi TaxID=2814293 RepID=A0ABX7QXS7_9GAMM|nr:CoA pyrophosphatase [Shewanella sedimentimangrovi]QSX35623.1 CoA pyrophosphatase [Shewanella sedimentimangrovi]
MNAEQFRLHFSLQPLVHEIVSAPAPGKLRQAAVLMALEEHNGELHLILTQRPNHLRAHPGQISFPGGKVEPEDINSKATALREAAEEIGLHSDNLEVLGLFPPHRTFTGFEITPVVALVKSPFELVLDPGEVAACFRAPLSYFLDDAHRHKRSFQRQGKHYQVMFMPWRQYFIWGATAAMIDLLCRHLKHGGIKG